MQPLPCEISAREKLTLSATKLWNLEEIVSERDTSKQDVNFVFSMYSNVRPTRGVTDLIFDVISDDSLGEAKLIVSSVRQNLILFCCRCPSMWHNVHARAKSSPFPRIGSSVQL